MPARLAVPISRAMITMSRKVPVCAPSRQMARAQIHTESAAFLDAFLGRQRISCRWCRKGLAIMEAVQRIVGPINGGRREPADIPFVLIGQASLRDDRVIWSA